MTLNYATGPDSASTDLTLKLNPTAVGNLPSVLKVYGVNYNVLRIKSGMCGLRYAN